MNWTFLLLCNLNIRSTAVLYQSNLEADKMKVLIQVVVLSSALCAATDFICTTKETTFGNSMDCNNRRLTQPPSGYWNSISRLEMANNDVSVLYKYALSGFPGLTIINLSSNKLTELNMEAFEDWNRNLRSLDVTDNRILKIVPQYSGRQFYYLNALALSDNPLSSLDPGFLAEHTPQLTTLSMGNTQLVVKKGEPVLNHPTLEILILDRSSNLTFGAKTLQGIPMLRQVSLMYCGITNVTEAFINNTLLESVSIGFNSITEITAGTFPTKNALRSLSLAGNPLTRLDVSAVENVVPAGGFVSIDYTPLACSCGYDSLYQWATGRGVKLSAICYGQEPCSFVKS